MWSSELECSALLVFSTLVQYLQAKLEPTWVEPPARKY